MMVSYKLLVYSFFLSLTTTHAKSCKNAPDPVSYRQGAPIQNSQDLNSSAFIGAPAHGKALKPGFKFYPEASLMHGDGGNSGSSDNPGPLGISPNISSSTNPTNIMVWGPDGSLTCGYANISAGSPPLRGLVAVDPTTLNILASWYPPVNESIGFAYMEYVQSTNDVLLNTKEGHIYVVHRDTCKGVPYFTTARTITLASVLRPGESLLNSMFDTAGNIWFTSGGISRTGDGKQNSTTYGYITPDGRVIKVHIENEIVENGIAVSGMNVYMVTGPSGTANKPNVTGHMYSLTSTSTSTLGNCNNEEAIKIHWRVPYDAGSGRIADGTSRGAGSTPILLSDQYVAITDKADSQIHLNVYHQNVTNPKEKQLACQVPLFTRGKSNNDNAIIGHFDGKTYGMMVQNNFNSPPLYIARPGASLDINGNWNDMSKMAGGMARIDIDPHSGKCALRWTSELAVKAVSVLSTKSGLLYSYVQDTRRAADGEYVWYVAGIDWDTGRTVFKVRTGAGGVFNDNWVQGTVGPDGTFYQSVLSGLVAVRDRR